MRVISQLGDARGLSLSLQLLLSHAPMPRTLGVMLGCGRAQLLPRCTNSLAYTMRQKKGTICLLCASVLMLDRHTHTRLTALFPGLPGWASTRKVKTNLDFTEARDCELQWYQLGHMQICTSLQTDNHASTPPLSFLQAGCPSCRPTNSVKALKGLMLDRNCWIFLYIWSNI